MWAIFLYLALGTFYPLFSEEPWSVSPQNPTTREIFLKPKVIPQDRGFSEWLFTFYQKYISSVDGQTCHYQPTCSQYSYEAFKKYGLIRAIFMTMDRLIRCHEGQREHPYDPPKWY